MSLKKRISDAFLEGEKEAEKNGAFFAAWWEFFGFVQDPFDTSPIDPFEKRNEGLFIDREETLEKLARLIGLSKNAQNRYKVIVVGASGVGKRSIARMILANVHELGAQGYIKNVTYGGFIPRHEGWSDESLPEDDTLRFVIFEDMSRAPRAREYFNYYDNRRLLVIALWNPEEIPSDLRYDEVVYVEPLNIDVIIELLIKRVEKYGSGRVTIDNAVISEIARYSMGVPLLGLSLAKDVLLYCYQRRDKNPSLHEVREVAADKGYGLPEHLDVTRKELQILKDLVTLGKTTPRELAEKLSISRVMAWKYLEQFSRDGLLDKQTVGKSAQYEIRLPARVRIQLQLYQRGDS
jgi:predicted DNA-binding transcriptional regulator